MITTTVVIALLLAAVAAARSGGPAVVTAGPASKTTRSKPSSPSPGCRARLAELRAGVRERRAATWRWQAELELARTPTRFAERDTVSCRYLRWVKHRWSVRADRLWRKWIDLQDPERAIRFVFGEYAEQALGVARCESGLSPRASNGQYLGIFQMGSSERQTYGHHHTPLGQARAAYRYFVASGRDWSPWQCRPDGGLAW